MDDVARWEAESATQFTRIIEAIATETGRTRSLPDLTEAERVLIDGRMVNLREGAEALADTVSRIGERQARAELFGEVAWLLSVAANLGLHDVSNPILERQRRDKNRNQTRPGRSKRSDKVKQRREDMKAHVRDAIREKTGEDAASIATRLRRNPEFKKRFSFARRTIEADVKAIMKSGNPE